MNTVNYLALGDSYTIGEAVVLQNNFPNQTVQILRQQGLRIAAPEILAKTGWTTAELLYAIGNWHFLPRYDFVSLLIGVNNQYRGLSINEFTDELKQLIEKAIQLADGQASGVAILSIPDYSTAPFSENLDRKKISEELVKYNEIIKEIAFQREVHYINTEEAGGFDANKDFIAPDGLHPSDTLYKIWAKQLSEVIVSSIKR